MGFSWTNIIRYVTEIAAAHINQVKTNVDSVYTDLELTAYNWLYLPVSVGDEIQHEDFKEMRDAIDYADNMNYCRSHDVSYMGADDAVARRTVYTGEKTGVDSTHRATVYSGQNSGYDSWYKSAYKNDHKSGVLSDENTGVDSGVHTTACGPVQSSYHTWYKSVDYNSHCTNYKG